MLREQNFRKFMKITLLWYKIMKEEKKSHFFLSIIPNHFISGSLVPENVYSLN